MESGQPLYGLTHLTPPLPTISLGPSKFPQLVYKCEVTNYGSIPVLNVRMFLNIDFQKPVERPGGGGFQGEGPLSRIEWPIDIAKIDPGQTNPFVFYFYNVSPYFAMVKIGDSVSFQRVDESDRRITRIVQPQYSPDFPILLSPFQKIDPTPNKKS